MDNNDLVFFTFLGICYTFFVLTVGLLIGHNNYPADTTVTHVVCNYLHAQQANNLCIKNGRVVYTNKDK